MKTTKTASISKEQLDYFLENGFIKFPGALSSSLVDEWTKSVWDRAKVDRADKKSWPKGGVFLDTTRNEMLKTLAPEVYGAVCDLVGGEDRIGAPQQLSISDGFLLNFPIPKPAGDLTQLEQEGKLEDPKLHLMTWHKDFPAGTTNFLDSQESGLIVFVLWSRTDGAGQGATRLATDSIAPVARVLIENPAGLKHGGLAPFEVIRPQCKKFADALGPEGTVMLVHPYMFHCSMCNYSEKLRIMTNRSVGLKAPLNFARNDGTGYSPVEAAVLRSLNVDKIEFKRAVAA